MRRRRLSGNTVHDQSLNKRSRCPVSQKKTTTTGRRRIFNHSQPRHLPFQVAARLISLSSAKLGRNCVGCMWWHDRRSKTGIWRQHQSVCKAGIRPVGWRRCRQQSASMMSDDRSSPSYAAWVRPVLRRASKRGDITTVSLCRLGHSCCRWCRGCSSWQRGVIGVRQCPCWRS